MSDQCLAKCPQDSVTSTPLPLPAELQNPGKISLNLAADLLEVAGRNWKRAAFGENAKPPYKGYDPFAGHREADDRAGFSRYREAFGSYPNPDFPGLPSEELGTIEALPGHGGWGVAKVVVVRPNGAPMCGWEAAPCVPDGVPICIDTPHGGDYLQACVLKGTGDWGAAKGKGKETSTWTFVLTDEGPYGWILASSYPGEPDPDPDFTGLKKGDVIDAAEARRRHLRVKEVTAFTFDEPMA